MDSLDSARLLLRPWAPTDADVVLDIYSRWEVQQFIGRVPRVMADRGEAMQAIERWRALEHPVHGVWAITSKEDGAVLGTALLKSIPASGEQEPLQDSGDTEVGWHLHPDAWGHGYATEAGKTLVRHGFAGGLERIVAVVRPENSASRRVAERIGLEYLGRTDKYYNTTVDLFEIVR